MGFRSWLLGGVLWSALGTYTISIHVELQVLASGFAIYGLRLKV